MSLLAVPVAVAVPPTINNPPNVPTLPPSANITIPQAPSPPGTGSNIASQNVAGGGSVTSVGTYLMHERFGVCRIAIAVMSWHCERQLVVS